MICRHLRRLEQELNAAGIPQVWRHERVETSLNMAAESLTAYREHFETVEFDCNLDVSAIRARLRMSRCVNVLDKQDAGPDALPNGFYCRTCDHAIVGVGSRRFPGPTWAPGWRAPRRQRRKWDRLTLGDFAELRRRSRVLLVLIWVPWALAAIGIPLFYLGSAPHGEPWPAWRMPLLTLAAAAFVLLPWVLTALSPRLVGLRCPHCGAPIHHAYSGVPGQALECRTCCRDMSKPASESPPPPQW